MILGTVNTRVYARGRGIVINKPSAVALDDSTGEVLAVGKEAKEMLGRTPGKITVIKPLRDGVIADFKVTEKMLNHFIQKAHRRRTLVHPRVIVSIPSEITQVEKRAVTDSAYRAKAAEVRLLEAGHDGCDRRRSTSYQARRQHRRRRRWGYDTTSLSSPCPALSIHTHCAPAGNHMDESIMNYLKRKYNLLIGERTAEQIKLKIGSASALDKPLTMEVKGRSLVEGVPKAITVDDSEIREALNECVAAVVAAIRVALERTPQKLSADISDRGIVLAGGGAQLRNLDRDQRMKPACPYALRTKSCAASYLELPRSSMTLDYCVARCRRLDSHA